MLIVNAKIYTMEQELGVIESGYLRTEGTRIAEIGPMSGLTANPAEEVIDAAGASLFPGFIDAHCHIGMWEDSIGFEGDDGNEETDPSTPHLRAVDAINPLDRCFREAAAAGITTVMTGPGSANPIGGQLLAMKTVGRRIDDMILLAPAAIKFALGENPKTVYHGKNQAPITRMATAAIIREQLVKAERYLQDCRHADTDEDTDLPDPDAKCEALLPLLRGEVPAHFHAHRSDDIFTAIRIAKEFNLNFAIVHGTEGYLTEDILAKEGVAVISGPFLTDRSKPELRNQTPQAPGILSRGGVITAICTDHPVIPIQYLPLCAGLAVREGMPWEDALAAITIVAAQICGVDERVGSLKPGKDADFLLFEGNPLTLEAKPKLVVVNGAQL